MGGLAGSSSAEMSAGRAFLEGGGEVGALMRTHDWSNSPLCAPESWPQSLRAIVALMLHSKFPMFVAWGGELGFLYNDPYAEILGAKHPRSLGGRFYDIWSEIWPDISPLIDAALRGEATYREDLPLVMNRKGYDEQTWFTFSYSPVRDESGMIAGMFCACTETTQRKRTEDALRQSRAQIEAELADTKLLQDLGAALIDEFGHGGALRKGPGRRRGDHALGLREHADVSPRTRSRRRTPPADVSRVLSGSGANSREWVGMDSVGSTCGAALRSGGRIITADVETCDFMAGTEDLAMFRQTGIRSCQTTPLLSRNGRLVGMISTHWRTPHRPTDRQLRMLDLVARQAADIIERGQAIEALRHRAAQHETLFNQSPLGVFLIDAGFRIREVNPVALPAFGDIPSLIGRDFDDVLRILWEPRYADELAGIFRHTLATGGAVHVARAGRVSRRPRHDRVLRVAARPHHAA